MSNPVSNVEIEDVLSSIRRLVSDEARASSRGRVDVAFHSDVPPQPVENEAKLNASQLQEPPRTAAPALVLTPSLRVQQPEEENAQTAQPPVQSDAAQDTDDTSALILSPDVQLPDSTSRADAEQAEGTAPEKAQPSEDAQPAMADQTPELEQPLDEVHPEPETLEPEQSVTDTSGDDETLMHDDQPLGIEAKIAALEALIGHAGNDFEPDGAEDGGNAARRGAPLPWEDSDERRLPPSDMSLPDPDDASHAASFSDASFAFQRAHAEAVSTAQGELESNVADALLDNDDPATLLDEEGLRDMVSEIVRQELQGPLGERITRNVRKLVRREIYRALAANELD
ncbi:hypothetical protein [Planktotalea arctica]|uniref:hypothetical protein n=1 Tax=Planktotalea arctica TaxID=1481893 RepID=UPI00321B6E5C